MKQNTPRETTLPIKLPKKSVENIDFKMSLSQIKVKFSLILTIEIGFIIL